MLMRLLVWAWTFILGGVFIVAATAKWFDPDGLTRVLSKTLGRLSPKACRRATVAIASAEAIVGMLCFLAGFSRFTTMSCFGLSLILLSTFTIWMIWVLSWRYEVTCACFGNLSSRLSYRTLARNLILVILTSVFASILGSHSFSDYLPLQQVLILAATASGFLMSMTSCWLVHTKLASSKQVVERLKRLEGM